MDIYNLLDETYYTVGVQFETDGHYNSRVYTYKVPKTIQLEMGDRIIVPARDTFKMVTVAAIHETPQAESSSIRWIVQKVDFTDYNAQLAREAQFRANLRVLEQMRTRNEMLETLRKSTVETPEAQQLLNATIGMVTAS